MSTTIPSTPIKRIKCGYRLWAKPAVAAETSYMPRGRQGYLTYAEVNDHLPEDIVDSNQIEDIIK